MSEIFNIPAPEAKEETGAQTFAALILATAWLILLAVSPALVIATWRALL